MNGFASRYGSIGDAIGEEWSKRKKSSSSSRKRRSTEVSVIGN